MKPSNLYVGLTALAAFIAMTLCSLQAQNQPAQPLSAYRDKHRMLLVFARTATEPSYREQTKLWRGEEAGFADRQLVVLPVLAEGESGTSDAPGALAKRFGVDAKSFEVILIGKDGHDAYRSEKPVTAEILYQQIDAMPMRREEMRRQKAKE